MKRQSIIISLSLFIMLFSVNYGNAQNVSFTPSASINKSFGDEDYWNLGFSVGANLFYSTAKTFSFGGRIAYNRMPPNGNEVLNSGDGPTFDFDVESTSGSFSMIEIVPSIQIATSTSDSDQDIRLSFQIGGGFFMSKRSDIYAKGTYTYPPGGWISGSFTQTTEFSDISQTKPGVQLGVDFSYKRKLMIQPLFSLIFNEENSTKYLSICIGYIFGK
jgi:hypothetical protein